MLASLTIRNFAIIEDLEVNFQTGLTIITGETGAGKSIIIDALSLLLGQRSSFDQIRYQASKAFIEGTFVLTDKRSKQAINQLVDDLVEDDNLLVVNRTLDQTGRSLLKINGRSMNLSTSKAIMSLVLDIHSQHENRTLYDEKTHLAILDNYIGADQAYDTYQTAYHAYKQAQLALSSLEKLASEDHDVDFLLYQIKEIENLDPHIGEIDALEAKMNAVRNIEKLAQTRRGLNQLIDGEYGSRNTLYLIMKETQRLGESFNDEAEKIANQYYELSATLDDVLAKLDKLIDLDDDPETIANRLYALKKVIKKYGSESEALTALDTMREQIKALDEININIEKAKRELAKAKANVENAGQILHDVRVKAGAKLAKAIDEQLTALALADAHFKVEFNCQEISASGLDHIHFSLSANRGSPFLALKNAISGGEASRLMLGIRIVLKQLESAETLIFDEVDTGVSGRIATLVGQKIKTLSENCQIITITHLPQVAAYGDHHYYVRKQVVNETTIANIDYLNQEESIMAIAKLLGSDPLSPTVIAAARELKRNAK